MSPPAEPLLEVSDLKVAYGAVEAVRGLSLQIERGEVVVLLGANGAGKTSTVRSICGSVPATGGRVRYQGEEILGRAPHRLTRGGMVLVPEGRRIIAPLSVEDNLLLGGFVRGGRSRLGDRLEEMYELFPVLRERRNLAGGLLSGGEQQMLALARAWMSEPTLLMMDEPTMGLAPVAVDVIVKAVTGVAASGVGVLMVEQNAMAVLPIADRVHVIEQGRIVYSGTPDGLREDETLVSAFLGIDLEDPGSGPGGDGSSPEPGTTRSASTS